MKKLIAWILIASAELLVSTSSIAQDAPASSRQMNMEQLKSRLNLTPEQQDKIKPLAEQRRAKLQEIHGKAGGAASRREKMSLMKEAKQVQDDFVAQVEPLLTQDQRAEWQKMRSEARDEMKERWRKRQQSQ